jgi:lysylphosphatidylglycerol synthetase-like protein (DUF2156 family)
MKLRSPWLLLAAAYATLPVMVGCAQFATPTARNAQIALTGLMALDTAQTVTIAREPDCLREINPAAVAIYGTENPKPKQVLITNAIYMAAHWALGGFLDRKANTSPDLTISLEQDLAKRQRWLRLQKIYWVATAIGHGAAVINNNVKRIRPFSSFECGGAQ